MLEGNRREMLALAAGASALALARPVIAAPATAEPLRTYMLMRGALDDRLVIGYQSGRYFGVVGAEVTPLYGVVSATFARYRPRPDGGFDGVSGEVSFFTDPDSGAVLDRWANPYTGETVTVNQANYPPAHIMIDRDLRLTAADAMPGLTISNRADLPEVAGDNLWMVERATTAFQPAGMPKPIRYSEVVTYHASRAAIANPKAVKVKCEVGFTAIVDWRPWLKMGDRPGHLLGNGHGALGATMAELPPALLKGLADRRPEVLKNPGGMLPPFA